MKKVCVYTRSANIDQVQRDIDDLLTDKRWRLVTVYWDGFFHVAWLEFE